MNPVVSTQASTGFDASLKKTMNPELDIRIPFLVILFTFLAGCADEKTMPVPADWPQAGWKATGNRISTTTEISRDFHPGSVDRPDAELSERAVGFLWGVELGQRRSSDPVIAFGKVVFQTYPDDSARSGRVVCFDEVNGVLSWSLALRSVSGNPDLPSFPYDPETYSASSPAMHGNQIFIVSSRGELLCLDAAGMENGNDGPFQDELAYLNLGNSESNVDLNLVGDILWRYDLLQNSSFSVAEIYYSHLTVIGNYLYVALPQNHWNSAEGFLQEGDIDGLYVFDIESGKRIAGNRLYQGIPYRSKVWAVPVSGSVNGLDLMFHPSRDGMLHGYRLPEVFPRGAWHHLERVWKFEINPIEFLLDRKGLPLLDSAAEKDSIHTIAGVGISAAPVWDQGKIFVAGGRDPGHSKSQGILYCLDVSVPVNDKEPAVLWSSRDLGATVSTASVIDGLVFIADLGGGIHCFDAESGKLYWTHHTDEMIVASTLAVDGRLFAATTQGRLLEFEVNREKTLRRTIVFPDPIRNSPVAANGRLYISTSRFFYVFD